MQNTKKISHEFAQKRKFLQCWVSMSGCVKIRAENLAVIVQNKKFPCSSLMIVHKISIKVRRKLELHILQCSVWKSLKNVFPLAIATFLSSTRRDREQINLLITEPENCFNYRRSLALVQFCNKLHFIHLITCGSNPSGCNHAWAQTNIVSDCLYRSLEEKISELCSDVKHSMFFIDALEKNGLDNLS